jgi:hypothetical protein
MQASCPKSHRKIDEELIREVSKQACVVCGKRPAGEAHHIKTKGSGGGDYIWNLCPVDRFCHQRFHSKGLNHMVRRFNPVREFLIRNNWEWDATLNRWVHYDTTEI